MTTLTGGVGPVCLRTSQSVLTEFQLDIRFTCAKFSRDPKGTLMTLYIREYSVLNDVRRNTTDSKETMVYLFQNLCVTLSSSLSLSVSVCELV